MYTLVLMTQNVFNTNVQTNSINTSGAKDSNLLN